MISTSVLLPPHHLGLSILGPLFTLLVACNSLKGYLQVGTFEGNNGFIGFLQHVILWRFNYLFQFIHEVLSRTMSKSKQTVVTSKDQAEINRFACLHMETAEKKNELSRTANTLQNLVDAEDELILLSDEDLKSVPFKIGSSFIHCDEHNDEINSLIEKEKEVLEDEVTSLTEQIKRNEMEMGQLKEILYEKFGDNINLENAEE
uniref:Prefoldin subunit 4 n=1 Tax=Steinernema glaseri TaxID=37863 RepID=A0A1I7YKZ8_9BILA